MSKAVDHDFNLILTKRKDGKGTVKTITVEATVRDSASSIKIERDPIPVRASIPYVAADWAAIEAAAVAKVKADCGIA